MNFKYGSSYECIISKSPAYKEGKVYKTAKHPVTGQLCLIGDDGLYDPTYMLVSKFKEAKDD